MAGVSTSIVWFRRDLRVHDQPALVAAVQAADRVVPLFVLDETLLAGRGGAPNRVWFLLESVRALRDELARLGAPLVVRVGRPERVVPELAADIRRRVGGGEPRPRPLRPRPATAGSSMPSPRPASRSTPTVASSSMSRRTSAPRRAAPTRVYSPFRRAWDRLPLRPLLPAPAAILAYPASTRA